MSLSGCKVIRRQLRWVPNVMGTFFCFSSSLFVELTRQQFCWLCSVLGVLVFPSQPDRKCYLKRMEKYDYGYQCGLRDYSILGWKPGDLSQTQTFSNDSSDIFIPGPIINFL